MTAVQKYTELSTPLHLRHLKISYLNNQLQYLYKAIGICRMVTQIKSWTLSIRSVTWRKKNVFFVVVSLTVDKFIRSYQFNLCHNWMSKEWKYISFFFFSISFSSSSNRQMSISLLEAKKRDMTKFLFCFLFV